MLEFLIELCIIMLFIVLGVCAVLHANEREKKGLSNKALCRWVFIPCILFMVFCIIGAWLSYESVTNTPTISYIDIETVYKLNEDEFIIKDKDGEIYTIDPVKICKGEKNQIICYTQPNLTEPLSTILGTDIYEYTLVLTNPDNVKKMPYIKK